jgi:hypothetical protein
MKQAIQLFEERKVRTVWDDEQERISEGHCVELLNLLNTGESEYF